MAPAVVMAALAVVMAALAVVMAGCTGSRLGTVSESGVYSPRLSGVAGELKPAGEDEFLAGNYKAARPLLTEAGRGGSLRAVFFLRIIVERGLTARRPMPGRPTVWCL